MRTVDRAEIHASLDRVFALAADVERWPRILSHYRWVRFLERRDGGGTVEMAARRPFGPLAYPVWWVSEMRVDRRAGEIRYRHVRGLTAGMDVVWQLAAAPAGPAGPGGPGGVVVTVVHEWRGPAWPLVGGLAARFVIGPVFIHGIASRTLAGLRRALEGS